MCHHAHMWLSWVIDLAQSYNMRLNERKKNTHTHSFPSKCHTCLRHLYICALKGAIYARTNDFRSYVAPIRAPHHTCRACRDVFCGAAHSNRSSLFESKLISTFHTIGRARQICRRDRQALNDAHPKESNPKIWKSTAPMLICRALGI